MAFNKLALFAAFLILFISLAPNTHSEVVNFTEDNWTDMLENEWMVEFYAPWCPACKALQSTWKDFAQSGEELNIKVGKVDVTASPGLSGRFLVTALPTIFHVRSGEFRQYKGTRDKSAFISFVQEKKWQQVDPVPSWKTPNSLQMTVVSTFFKLSQALRQIHNRLMEDFGLPTWGSYLIFAIATIISGAVLGLVLVCFIDFIYPPKKIALKTVKGVTKKEKCSDDELDDDEIKDDLIDDINLERSGSETEESKPQSNPSSPRSTKKRKPRRAE